jgi:small subunit ribosomal protein S7
MSRRIAIKKQVLERDLKYNNILVSLLINKILKSGKKRLAQQIVYKAFNFISIKLKQNPIQIFEKALRNISPRIQLITKIIDGIIHKIPKILNLYTSTKLAIRWLIQFAKKRSEKGIYLKLANEILNALKGFGNSIKRKEEIHKIAGANKAFLLNKNNL